MSPNGAVVVSVTFTELSEMVLKPTLHTRHDGVPRRALRQCAARHVDVDYPIGLPEGGIVFDGQEALECLQVLSLAHE